METPEQTPKDYIKERAAACNLKVTGSNQGPVLDYEFEYHFLESEEGLNRGFDILFEEVEKKLRIVK